ncbi:MAG TPA: hypothetical protein VK658_17375 [Chryseolinea sp.]|nr:hypothetical protein [Chryseolinea sp.]
MRWAVFILCVACLAACSDDDDDFDACDVANPEELTWFKEATESLNQSGEISQYMYFTQAEYQGQRVYLQRNCCPSCNSVILVFDCAGNELGWLGSGEDAIKTEDIKNESVAWKSDGNVCAI